MAGAASADTMLRVLESSTAAAPMRSEQTTVLVLDILPDREPAALAAWLRAHPGP